MTDNKNTSEMPVEHFNVFREPQVKTHGRKQSGGSFSSKTWLMIALAVLIVLAIVLIIIISIILATILRSQKPTEEGKQIRRESRK